LQSSDVFQQFLQARIVEIHGPSPVNFLEKIAAISKVAGYPIRLNTITEEQFVKTLVSYGVTKLMARSFAHTVMICGGDMPSEAPNQYNPQETSQVLLATGWKPKYDLDAWVNSEHVAAAFRK